MHIQQVHPWNLIESSKKLTSFFFFFFLQCWQLLVHLSDESAWFIYKAFYGHHLYEMTYGYKLIDTRPDAFDVSEKAANTFYCVV